jgi:hypothetical protein
MQLQAKDTSFTPVTGYSVSCDKVLVFTAGHCPNPLKPQYSSFMPTLQGNEQQYIISGQTCRSGETRRTHKIVTGILHTYEYNTSTQESQIHLNNIKKL